MPALPSIGNVHSTANPRGRQNNRKIDPLAVVRSACLVIVLIWTGAALTGDSFPAYVAQFHGGDAIKSVWR